MKKTYILMLLLLVFSLLIIGCSKDAQTNTENNEDIGSSVTGNTIKSTTDPTKTVEMPPSLPSE